MYKPYSGNREELEEEYLEEMRRKKQPSSPGEDVFLASAVGGAIGAALGPVGLLLVGIAALGASKSNWD